MGHLFFLVGPFRGQYGYHVKSISLSPRYWDQLVNFPSTCPCSTFIPTQGTVPMIHSLWKTFTRQKWPGIYLNFGINKFWIGIINWDDSLFCGSWPWSDGNQSMIFRKRYFFNRARNISQSVIKIKRHPMQNLKILKLQKTFDFLAFRHMFEGLNDDLIGQCRLKLMSKCIFSKTFLSLGGARKLFLAHHTARLTGFEKTFIVVFKLVIFLAFRCRGFIFPVKFTRIKIIWPCSESNLDQKNRDLPEEPDLPVCLRWYLRRVSLFLFLDTSL